MLLIGLGLLKVFVAFGISKAFDGWHDGLLQKLHFYGIAGLSLLSNGSLRCFLLKKNFMAPIYGWGSTASRLEPL